jgi:hypothetical protein
MTEAEMRGKEQSMTGAEVKGKEQSMTEVEMGGGESIKDRSRNDRVKSNH